MTVEFWNSNGHPQIEVDLPAGMACNDPLAENVVSKSEIKLKPPEHDTAALLYESCALVGIFPCRFLLVACGAFAMSSAPILPRDAPGKFRFRALSPSASYPLRSPAERLTTCPRGYALSLS